MTEKEIIEQQQANGNTLFYLQRTGLFFCAYGGGAYALARITGYGVMRKHRKAGDLMVAGFPQSVLPKVIRQFRAKGVGLFEDPDSDGMLYTIRGGDGTPDESLLQPVREKSAQADAADSMDYLNLKGLRKELLAINLADLTPQEAVSLLRNLQIRCLSHMPL